MTTQYQQNQQKGVVQMERIQSYSKDGSLVTYKILAFGQKCPKCNQCQLATEDRLFGHDEQCYNCGHWHSKTWSKFDMYDDIPDLLHD